MLTTKPYRRHSHQVPGDCLQGTEAHEGFPFQGLFGFLSTHDFSTKMLQKLLYVLLISKTTPSKAAKFI